MKFFIFETIQHDQRIIIELKNSISRIPEKIEFIYDILKADFIISFGGDGTLLDCFNLLSSKKLSIPVIPIRDYKLCQLHENFSYHLSNILNKENKLILEPHRILSLNNKYFGISEFVIRNKNISKAIRLNLYINEKLYISHIIGDGLIISTALGSTGYFKSITNTFFSEGLGIGFINNTQNMSNLIINENDKIKIFLERGDVEISLDHYTTEIKENSILELELSNNVFNTICYKSDFMCSRCRNKRHGATLNSLYEVI